MIKLNWVIFSTISVLLTTMYKRLYENSEELLSITFDTKLNSFLSLNVVLCGMLLATKVIERTVFGEFREQEFVKSYERLINYFLLKVVFFVGAFTVPSINLLVVWSIWYSVMGSLFLATLLCKDRFEYLSHVNSKLSDHLRIISFLVVISSLNIFLFYFLYTELSGISLAMLLLLSYENVIVSVHSVQLFTKYSIYFSKTTEEKKGTQYFYSEIITDSLYHLTTALHYFQILFKNGITFTLLDVVIFLNVHSVFSMLRTNFASFVNFQKLETLISKYPNVSQADLRIHNDNCAICREPVLSSAKKLPCSHIYHESCLRLWLQHCLYSPSCPTCRFPLIRKPQNESSASIRNVVQSASHSTSNIFSKPIPQFKNVQKASLKKSSSWAPQSISSSNLYKPRPSAPPATSTIKSEEVSRNERRMKILNAAERRRALTQEL